VICKLGIAHFAGITSFYLNRKIYKKYQGKIMTGAGDLEVVLNLKFLVILH